MNVTSRAAPVASQPRFGTSPHLIASWSEEGVVWDVTHLEGGEEAAWWAWLLAEVGVATVIVVGDVSLLMLFFTRKLLGQSTNILVFSIAVADLMTGLLVLPLDVLQRVLSETSGYMCKSYFYFSNVSKTAMIYTVTMLALERIVAALNMSFRILTPGRCLFFSSLTWFFAAAYNIWSVVLYNTSLLDFSQPYKPSEAFEGPGNKHQEAWTGGVAGGGGKGGRTLGEVLNNGAMDIEGSGGGAGGSGDGFVDVVATSPGASSFLHNYSTHVCLYSTRFQRLVDIFVVLDHFVTFLFPALASVLLFVLFWRRRHTTRAPGRPYRSSTSVIIFTFALLVSFLLCHVPLEIVALHVHSSTSVVTRNNDDSGDVRAARDNPFLVYKMCQLVSFTRGFWDVFIFGAFRHYVCRKERALANFRESQFGSDRGGSCGLGQGGGREGTAGDGEGQGGLRQTASLMVPVTGPAPSTSLLDSDQEVTVTPHRSSTSEHEH